MTPGALVRRVLPTRVERLVADAYRDVFVDLDELARTIGSLGVFSRAVEVGCGEGALASRLSRTTDAQLLGIDIAADPGRNYTGAPGRASFRQTRVEELVGAGHTADLVVLSDVVHHVPTDERVAFLRSCRALLTPGGLIVVKEWERRPGIAHALAYGSDRYVSGDRNVGFLTRAQLVALVHLAAPDLVAVCETRVPPRRNNLLLGLRAPA